MEKIIQIILALFLPPVAVVISKGIGKDFVINIILTIIMFVPGVIHAFYVTMGQK